jgi:hypothetical protein
MSREQEDAGVDRGREADGAYKLLGTPQESAPRQFPRPADRAYLGFKIPNKRSTGGRRAFIYFSFCSEDLSVRY